MTYRAFGAILTIASLSACGGGGGVNSASSCPLVTTGPCTNPPPDAPSPVPIFSVQTATTYTTIGGAQKLGEAYRVLTDGEPPVKGGELYTAGQLPLGSDSVAISYDPRNAVFSLKFDVEDIKVSPRFQDPAHRTDFDPLRTPDGEVPDLPQLSYLEAGTANTDLIDIETFFYESPGTKTRYVTLAGYTRDLRKGPLDGDFDIARTRGTAVFGNQSRPSDVPSKGTATYHGNMLATFVAIDLDANPGLRSRLEWLSGTASVAVDFGKGTVSTSFQGSVVPAAGAFEGGVFEAMAPSHAGASFNATGTAKFDTTGLGYAGKIDNANFAGAPVNIAASSMDGTFFGPGAVETGGAFRVVGATPDERVDFIGAFTGVK